MSPIAYRDVLPIYGFPAPQTEYRFCLSRRWRLDLALPEWLVGIEIDGGIWSKGRHVRGHGYLSDQEKMNEAQIMGWLVLRTTPQNLTGEKFIDQLTRALQSRGWRPEKKPVAVRPFSRGVRG